MAEQIRADELANMTPDQIRDATRDGRMDVVLGVRPAPVVGLDPAEVDRLADDPDRLRAYVLKARADADVSAIGSDAWFKHSTPDEIRKALEAGELDAVLRGDG